MGVDMYSFTAAAADVSMEYVVQHMYSPLQHAWLIRK
jgi:hypothetical protein